MQEEFFDALRHLFVLFWIWSFFPAILVSGSNLMAEKADIEIRAYRLQQYEYVGKLYGSRSWRVLYDAVSLNGSSLRKCVIVSWRDLVNKELETTVGAGAGALLVLLPEEMDALTETEREAFLALEQKFAAWKSEQAVYFAPNSEMLTHLLHNVALSTKKSPSTVEQLWNAVAADNYQISSTVSASTNSPTLKTYNVIGTLNAADRGRPYLFVVAHYDTHGTIPALGTGVDSNGSGVAVLLELLATLSGLYNSGEQSQRPKLNIVFVLSTGGKFSYQGSRQWVDDFREKHPEEKVLLAICLDSLGKGNSLHAHVSKTLQEGSVSQKFVQQLENFAGERRTIGVVAKKINLNAERLAWEHEIYNMRRVHALTLSHFKDHADPMRNSILDTSAQLNPQALEENAKLITNTIVSFIYDLDPTLCKDALANKEKCSLLTDESGVNRERLAAWMDLFASGHRSINSASTGKLASDLKEVVQKYADRSSMAEVSYNDFTVYEIIEDKLLANIVKPAVFELLLALIIGVYLFGIYHIALNAQPLLENSVLRVKKILY